MRSLCSSASKQLPTITLVATIFFFTLSFAQPTAAQQQAALGVTHLLITPPVDESQLTILKGNTHPMARPEFNLGTAPAALPMQRMLLVLKRSPKQESALRQFLDDQQDKSSPSYHKWLTPEEYGKQFGPSDADIQTITTWLQSHGFEVGSTKGRTVLEFSGSASQVQQAFHTTIHKYLVNGEQHWANSGDPSIPTALTPAVAGIASLNNFPRKAMNRFVGRFSRDKATGRVHPAAPLFTYRPGYKCSADDYCFALGPYDFATIYNVLPLWNANINGTGQTIAIVGESNINPQDVANFRSLFDLPPNSTGTGNPLNIILNGPDPGLQGDESEADIDVQWSGAVAPYATIDFVVSQSTETTSGVDLSAVYIVDNNLAPIMSESYGECELGIGTSGNQFYNTLWQQAAAQGITVFIAAGDNGAAGCDNFGVQSPAPAQFGLEVSGYASTPYNVAVGGTDFSEFTNPETYWSTTNNPTTQASALGYIPETTWNDSCTNANLADFGFSNNAETNCNDSRLIPYYVVPGGGSGGASNCTSPTGNTPANCTGGYPKPSWQTGTGVPNDGKRDLPDVSLFASNGFAGSFYLICQSDQTDGACTLNQQFLGFGGTSVSSPAFAGIMALVNQQTGSRQGNANYAFYKLAAKDTLSSCNATSSPASSCIFNDVTSGTIAMPCAPNSPNCTTSPGDTYGVLNGYNAGTGYDQATGLGSVNANNLVTQWSSVTSLPSTTTLNSLTPTTITHGQTVNFSVAVTPQSGPGTPTGEISLLGGTSGTSPASIGFNLSGGAVSGTTNLLPGGTYSVTAHYPGDGTYAASDSNPISVTVGKENSTAILGGVFLSGSKSPIKTFSFDSQFFVRADVGNSQGSLCSPPPFGEVACPSGGVIFTVDGIQTNFNTFALNSEGYTETWLGALGGLSPGTHTLAGQYGGDNNYNASTGSVVLTVTKASTDTTIVAQSGYAGQPLTLTTSVEDPNSPFGFDTIATGTVTFFANGVAIPGTPTYGIGDNDFFIYMTATLVTTFSIPGTYTLTASYAGDSNFLPSSSPSTTLTLQFPQSPIVLQSSAPSIPPGSPVSLIATIPGASKTIAPTGTISFAGFEGPFTAPVSYSTFTDPSTGNLDLQGTLTISPTFSDFYFAQYSGDINYPAVQTDGFTLALTVTGMDFSLVTLPAYTSFTVHPGNTATGYLLAGVQSETAPVSFGGKACAGLPSESSCTFNPNPVDATGGFNVFVKTTAPHALALRQSEIRRTMFWSAMLIPLTGILLIGVPRRPRLNWRMALVLGLLLLTAGCGGSSSASGGGGGGGGGGGTTDPGTPVGTYQITVTGTSGSITHSTTFTLIVQ